MSGGQSRGGQTCVITLDVDMEKLAQNPNNVPCSRLSCVVANSSLWVVCLPKIMLAIKACETVFITVGGFDSAVRITAHCGHVGTAQC